MTLDSTQGSLNRPTSYTYDDRQWTDHSSRYLVRFIGGWRGRERQPMSVELNSSGYKATLPRDDIDATLNVIEEMMRSETRRGVMRWDVMRCDETWRELTKYDEVWRDGTWWDVTRRDVTRCDELRLKESWRELTRCDETWRDEMWRSVTRGDEVWRDKIWRGVTRWDKLSKAHST